MNFKDLIGKRVGFCGVDNNAFCVVAPDGNRVAFEAIEDENDGYRSALDELKPVPVEGHIFFGVPIALVTAKEVDDGSGYDSFVGYALVDDAGHEWLRAGTRNHDDYYPCFTFDYSPPKEATP